MYIHCWLENSTTLSNFTWPHTLHQHHSWVHTWVLRAFQTPLALKAVPGTVSMDRWGLQICTRIHDYHMQLWLIHLNPHVMLLDGIGQHVMLLDGVGSGH